VALDQYLEMRLWRAFAGVLAAQREWRVAVGRCLPPEPQAHSLPRNPPPGTSAASHEAALKHASIRVREAQRRHVSTVRKMWGAHAEGGLYSATQRYYNALCSLQEEEGVSLRQGLTRPEPRDIGSSPSFPFGSTTMFLQDDYVLTPLAAAQSAREGPGSSSSSSGSGSDASSRQLLGDLRELCIRWLLELGLQTCSWICSDNLAYVELSLRSKPREMQRWQDILTQGALGPDSVVRIMQEFGLQPPPDAAAPAAAAGTLTPLQRYVVHCFEIGKRLQEHQKEKDPSALSNYPGVFD
jgi:hypothetical protein